MKKIILIIMATVILAGCDYKTENGYVNRKNVHEYLDKLSQGKISGTPGFYYRKLNDLEEYIDARKDKVYKSEEEKKEYLFDKGLIYLSRSEFIKAFPLLREYLDLTGDKARVYYNIADKIGETKTSEVDEIYSMAVLATKDTFPEPLTIDQQVWAFNGNMTYPLLVMGDALLGSEEFLSHKHMIIDISKILLKLKSTEIDAKMINHLYELENLPENRIAEVLSTDIATKIRKLDYVIAYYINPLHPDFNKAAYFADQRDYREWGTIFPDYRIEVLIRAYIGAGEYNKALVIYEYHKHRFDDEGLESITHLNLLLAVAHAGLGQLEESFSYLSREFEITEIKETWLEYKHTNSKTIVPDRKGDMLRSLFEVYFFFDEFRAFEDTPWQQKFEDMVNRNLNRYSSSKLFDLGL